MCEIAEGLDGGVDEPLPAFPVGHVVGVGDGLPAHLLDLVDDLLGRRAVVARAVHGTTEVVDHDLGAFACKEQGVLAPDSAAGSGDDRNFSIQRTHDRGVLLGVSYKVLR